MLKTTTFKELKIVGEHKDQLKRKELYSYLFNMFRDSGDNGGEATLVAAAYAMYIWKNEEYMVEKGTKEPFKYFKDDSIRYYIQERLINFVGRLVDLLKEFSNEDLLSLIFFYPVFESYRMVTPTPEGICNLAKKFLEIKDKDTVADFGAGTGRFILNVCEDYPKASLLANELDTSYMVIIRIKCELLGVKIDLDQNDMFNYFNEKRTFDKIFCDHPFGMSMNNIARGNELRKKMLSEVFGNVKMLSGDWFYNYLFLNCLKHGGKAVTIMTAGSTWNKGDQAAREFFIENGLVETIVALPPNLFETTGISFMLVVLSRGNNTVRMIDATKVFHKGRRVNTMTEEDIVTILAAKDDYSKISKTIARKTIADNDYALNPTRYLTEVKPVKNGIKLGDLVRSISRGAQLRAIELDKLSTTKKTDCQYLMLANIENGIINDDLPYLKEISKADLKYCLKNEDIVLSKIGRPFKVAMAQVEAGRKILANGNLYIIEVDKDKVNPYYILAYLNSDDGIAAMNRMITGSTIPSISVTALKTLQIPMVSIERQNNVAKKYLAKLDELAVLRIKIEKTKDELRTIISQEGC